MILEVNKKLFKEETFTIEDAEPTGSVLVDLSKLVKYDRVALQIDGGGIKGIMPAYKLYTTEYNSKGSFRIQDVVTDYYGTSTGSIIAAALYLGIPIFELLKFYIEDGPRVFEQRNIIGKILRGSLFKKKELAATLQVLFGKVTFKEAQKQRSGCSLNVAIVSKLERKTIICNHKNTPDMPIWIAVRASTAAPMFFPPMVYMNEVYVDGGTGVYNSLLEKAIDQYMYHEELKKSQYYIISLGCGTEHNPIENPTDRQLRKAAKCSKIKSLLFTVLYGRDETVHRQVNKFRHLQDAKKVNGVRWDITLPDDLTGMAETDNINELIDLVEEE